MDYGWICRPCQRGDHQNCQIEAVGSYCICVEGECGEE